MKMFFSRGLRTPAKLLVFYVKAKGTPPTVLLGDGEK
jgi:hypothetical protein